MMTEFTPEWIEEQLDKFHDSTNHEWLTECWNNYGLSLEEIQRLQSRVQELEAGLEMSQAVIDAGKKVIAELEAEQRWIPVTPETLPKCNEVVLTYSNYANEEDKYNVGFYVLNSNKKPNWVNNATYNNIYPTHWRSLPKPPKEEK